MLPREHPRRFAVGRHACVVAATAGMGCQAVLGIQDPREIEGAQDAGQVSTLSDPTAEAEMALVDAASGDAGGLLDGVGVDATSAADGHSALDSSAIEVIDAASLGQEADGAPSGDSMVDASALTDADAGPSPDPCATVMVDGAYCGFDGQWNFDTNVANPNALYTCVSNMTVSETLCVNGCTVNQFTDDTCN
jgi:hypothetical protein